MITPMDIHNKTFTKAVRGYAPEEVNGFLDELVGDYERIYREHREMEEKMDTLKTKLANYEKIESTMSNTLIMAQETAENVKKAAQKEADLIVDEAKARARQILADSEMNRLRINDSLLKAEGDMKLYLEKLLVSLKSATSMVEDAKSACAPMVIAGIKEQEVPEETQAAEPEEVKETVSAEAEETAPAAEETVKAAEPEGMQERFIEIPAEEMK
jgi:cell division initiation protein